MSEKKRQSPRKDSLQTCIVCCHTIDNVKRFNTVGMCGHVGCCSLCSLRMRQLLDNKTCTICKSELPRVICIRNSSETFESYQDWGDNIGPSHVFDESSGIFFLKDDYNQVHAMRDTMCRKCNSKFPSLNALKSHLLEAHQLQFCNICLDHKKVFLQEHELFTKDALKRHTAKGNPKHGFSGHPRCDFCQSRHYSNTELYEHLHKNHFECDICVRSYGVQNRYYKDYHDLENHFRSEHFLCEEPVCLAKKFVVFKTHIDFQAHISKEHPYIKTNKKLDVHFKIKRATRDGSGMAHSFEQDDGFQQYPGTGNYEEVDNDVINVADFPSLSGSDGGVQLHLWESQRVTTPTIDDFPELPQSNRLSNTQHIRGASAFRNALAPPPTPAMMAHMRNDDSWEYPDIANAAEALGTNNPLLRFVKPSKKKKKVKSNKKNAPNQAEHNNEPLRENNHSGNTDGKQDSVSTSEVKLDSTEGRDISKSALVLKIRQTLGSDERYERFREKCKQFRLREIEVDSFHTETSKMFSPGDFETLFLNLLSLLPDKDRSKEFIQYHLAQKDRNQKGKGQKLESQEKKKNYTSVTQRQSNTSSTPASSGWANALRQSGFSAPQRSPQNPKVNKSQTLKGTRNTVTWNSATSWEAVSSLSSRGGASGTATTSSEDVVVEAFPSLTVEDLEEKVPTPAPRTNASSFKANRSDFPALPSAGKPVGVQPVTRATWNEQFQTIAQAGTQNNTKGGGKKKQKKKLMTLGELAMKFN